jgi:hypothetical protein
MKNKWCPCPNKACERNGNCEACQNYHHTRGEKTFCGK